MWFKWFKRAERRAADAARSEPEKWHAPTFRFLYEPDGQVFREFRAAVTPTLAEFSAIRRGYLALVEFGDSPELNVVLCAAGPENAEFAHAVGAVFKSVFAASQHLDIMFLSAEQEADLALNQAYRWAAWRGGA